MSSSTSSTPLHKLHMEGFSTSDASMTNFHYFRVTYSPNKPRINLAQLCKEYRIFARANIPITPTESIDMSIQVHMDFHQDYTMQYRDNQGGLKIRCDTAHGAPHIDIEWPGEKQKKTWLTKDPADYEEAINLILINAEQNNPLIGALYWLIPTSTSVRDDKVHVLQGLWFQYAIQTPLTIVARAATVRLLNESIQAGNKSISAAKILEDVCKDISRQEKILGGPLAIQEVTYRSDIGAYPFAIFQPSGSDFVFEEYPSGKDIRNDLVGVSFIS